MKLIWIQKLKLSQFGHVLFQFLSLITIMEREEKRHYNSDCVHTVDGTS